jgi:hypothetical protein
MRNIRAELQPKKNYWLLSGGNIQIRLDNCKIANQGAIDIFGEKSSYYITSSSFVNSGIQGEGASARMGNGVCSNTSGRISASAPATDD